MNVLEQILEEIEERVQFRKKLAIYNKRKGTLLDVAEDEGALSELDIARRIVCSYMDDANDGWIPVKERMPFEEETILVTVKHSSWISDYDSAWVPEEEKIYHPEKRGVYKGKYEEGIWWFTDEENEWIRCEEEANEARDLGIIYDTVLAWQPLPEPYKGEYSYE